MKSKLLNNCIAIFALITILLLFQGINFIKAFGVISFFFIIAPLFPFFILKKIAHRKKLRLLTINIIVTMLMIVTILYFLLIELLLITLQSGLLSPFPVKSNNIERTKYNKGIAKLERLYGAERIAHFPNSIPEDATNYYFQLEDAFDGLNTHYIMFNSNKQYINNVKNKYKKDCIMFTTKAELSTKNIDIYINEIKDDDKICLLHRKNAKEIYTSGVVTKYPNTVIFFFADF